jgi:hypothetical protein
MRGIPKWKMLFRGRQSWKICGFLTLLSDILAMVLIVALAALGTLAYGLC